MKIDELVETLKEASDAYYNGDPIMSDAEYDVLEFQLQERDPTNKFLIGVGSDVRGSKVSLPYPLGSLNQVYDGELSKWISSHNLSNDLFCVTAKLDGVSALLVYDDDGEFQIAYSRGNGTEGADISRHITKIAGFTPKFQKSALRCEVIMSKNDFKAFSARCEKEGTRTYKTARNAVSGLLNAEKNLEWVYEFVSIVVYDVIDGKYLEKFTNKRDALENLVNHGFDIPMSKGIAGRDIDEAWLQHLIEIQQERSPYEEDGLVIEIDQYDNRSKVTSESDSLNPPYAKKYKVLDHDNIKTTKVVDVHWNVSKTGKLKPKVEIEPVEIQGVTIRFATGFNAKFIEDNKVGPGAEIQITRSGDVIPFILNVTKPREQYTRPVEDIIWCPNKVDYVLTDRDCHEIVQIKQITDFFDQIGVDGLKMKSVEKIYNRGFTSIEDIIHMDSYELCTILGKNGEKISKSIDNALNGILEYKLFGATHFGGHGIGVRKMKKLYEAHQTIHVDMETIIETKGFDEKTAMKIVSGMQDFKTFKSRIEHKLVLADAQPADDSLKDTVWVFTGFRDKEALAIIESRGGRVGSAVSGKTTHVVTKDPTKITTKLKKAQDLGIDIMGPSQMYDIING